MYDVRCVKWNKWWYAVCGVCCAVWDIGIVVCGNEGVVSSARYLVNSVRCTIGVVVWGVKCVVRCVVCGGWMECSTWIVACVCSFWLGAWLNYKKNFRYVVVEAEPCKLRRWYCEETTHEVPVFINGAIENLKTTPHKNDIATCCVSGMFTVNAI